MLSTALSQSVQIHLPSVSRNNQGTFFEIPLVLSFYWFSSSAWLMLSILIIALHLCFYWFLELAPWLCFASVYALYINMIFTFTRDVRQPLPQIRLSLCVSLGAGQIIFLSGINATEKMVSGYILLVEFLQRRHSWTKRETKKKWIFWSFLSFLLQTACITSAVLMQYFLMAAFCWMLQREFIFTFLLRKFITSATRCIFITSCHGVC